MDTEIPLRTPEQAAKTAARHNKKLAQRFPLLADQLDVVGAWDTKHVLETERVWRERMAAAEQKAKDRGDVYRNLVAQRVTDEALSDLDAYFKRVLPQDDMAYWADFWWQKLKIYWPEQVEKMRSGIFTE